MKELVATDKITISRFVRNYESVLWFIDKVEDVNKIIDIIDVPYLDYFEVEESTDSVYDLLFKGSEDFYFITFKINEDEWFRLDMWSMGYAILSTTEKSYISLTKVDCESIYSICDSICNGPK